MLFLRKKPRYEMELEIFDKWFYMIIRMRKIDKMSLDEIRKVLLNDSTFLSEMGAIEGKEEKCVDCFIGKYNIMKPLLLGPIY